MLVVALLGARYSGKSTLAQTCLGSAPQKSPKRPDTPRSFSVVCPDRVPSARVLDPKSEATRAGLGAELARRTVAAALVTMPRDADNADDARQRAVKWSTFARAHCDDARIALVVTKSKVRFPPLREHEFERAALEAMKGANVERIFYTDAETQRPAGVKHWLLDVLAARRTDHESCCASNGVYIDLLAYDAGRQKQRTCDACSIC